MAETAVLLRPVFQELVCQAAQKEHVVVFFGARQVNLIVGRNPILLLSCRHGAVVNQSDQIQVLVL